MKSSPRSPQPEKSPYSSEDPAQPKIKYIYVYIYIIVLKKKWKIILSTNSVSCTILGDIQSVRMIHSTSYVANMVYKFLEMQW